MNLKSESENLSENNKRFSDFHRFSDFQKNILQKILDFQIPISKKYIGLSRFCDRFSRFFNFINKKINKKFSYAKSAENIFWPLQSTSPELLISLIQSPEFLLLIKLSLTVLKIMVVSSKKHYSHHLISIWFNTKYNTIATFKTTP